MKKINVEDLPTFDPSEVLDTPEAISTFLSSVMEDNDPNIVIGALEHIVRSYGITQLAKQTGISREMLYQALKGGNTTNFKIIINVVNKLLL